MPLYSFLTLSTNVQDTGFCINPVQIFVIYPSSSMKINNFYVSYKRDTRLLLYWMIKTSNSVIASLNDFEDDFSLKINVTGETTVSDLVSMSQLIAKHRRKIPSPIYHLFQSVIELRSLYYTQFQQLASVSPSQELARNNSTHKHFIDTLTKAFRVLGGEGWLAKEQEKQKKSDGEEGDASTSFAFTNKFSVLDLESDSENDDAPDDADQEESNQDPGSGSSAAPQQRQRRQNRRDRRRKKKGKNPQSRCKSGQGQTLADVPLESYRIIEDDGMTEYVMAVLALTRDWIQLRSLFQDMWRRVAYKNLNSAVAATLAHIAVAMIKQSEATIFIDFPGYESYEMIMQTITRGDVEKAQNEFRLSISDSATTDSAKTTTEISLDIKEIFLIHTYQDLVDFITDYQKTRSGKPTKRMLAQIDSWEPNLDLRKATKEERIKWRRSYTINWLYDLVNIVACVAISGGKGKSFVLEDVDWSNQGPFRAYRRMFGLMNFAAAVTTLAMQKPGVNFRHKIPPHLVFHLQCIMDAWTVSRGWAISGVEGHILSVPAPGFHPRRDLDVFLGREESIVGIGGYFRATFTLKAFYMRFRTDSNPRSFEHTVDCIGVLEKLGCEFLDALGRCKILQDLASTLPSRFAKTNPNGVWDYSPFFCGAGLAEGLELMYRSVMILWDGMREPMLVVHLHNMLVQRGYLKRAVSLYSRLSTLFIEGFFFDGQPPTADFGDAFHAHVDKMVTRKDFAQERANRRSAAKVTHTREFLKLILLRLFKQKSSLLLYQIADWDPDRIPDCDVDPRSALGMIRLSQTKRFRDSEASDWRLEETELVKRTRASGLDEQFIMTLDPFFDRLKGEREEKMARMTLCIPDCASTKLSWLRNATNKTTNKRENEDSRDCEMTAEMMLSILWNDIHGDICGGLRPYSSINYLWITIRMLQYFDELEVEAHSSGSAMLRAMYCHGEKSKLLQGDKRLLLSLRALDGHDTELLKSMAKVFERCGGRLVDFMYWAPEEDDDEKESNAKDDEGPVVEGRGPDCCVM